MTVDKLDMTLLKFLSTGINSYEELARKCKVTRNTVYRRIAALEKSNIITNVIRCTVNFENLDITSVIITATLPTSKAEEAVCLLSAHPKVRFLWRTYGDQNIALIAFCLKGEEGQLIDDLKRILEEKNCSQFHVSTGYTWEKSEISPFDAEPDIETIDLKEIRLHS
jgi:DNA-binding Lrp family transcriptional regulator